MQLPALFDAKPVLSQAFKAAKGSIGIKDDYISSGEEYRLLLKYLA